jgi:hypothetical protein
VEEKEHAKLYGRAEMSAFYSGIWLASNGEWAGGQKVRKMSRISKAEHCPRVVYSTNAISTYPMQIKVHMQTLSHVMCFR